MFVLIIIIIVIKIMVIIKMITVYYFPSFSTLSKINS
jgi:hypothetical protein